MFCTDNTANSKEFDIPKSVVVLKRIKIIKCEKCTSVFTTQSEYKLHKLKHDLQNIKQKRRAKIRSYYRNNNTIGFVKKYECDDCDMKFVEKSTLEAHSALHKPFPFVCNCGVGFYDKEDLKCHIKIVHEVKTNETRSNIPKNMIILGSKKPRNIWTK